MTRLIHPPYSWLWMTLGAPLIGNWFLWSFVVPWGMGL